MSRMTWRASMLSAVGVVGFMGLFHHSDTASSGATASGTTRGTGLGVAGSGSAIGRAGQAHQRPASTSRQHSGPANRTSATHRASTGRHPARAAHRQHAVAPPSRPPARSHAPAQTSTSGSTVG